MRQQKQTRHQKQHYDLRFQKLLVGRPRCQGGPCDLLTAWVSQEVNSSPTNTPLLQGRTFIGDIDCHVGRRIIPQSSHAERQRHLPRRRFASAAVPPRHELTSSTSGACRVHPTTTIFSISQQKTGTKIRTILPNRFSHTSRSLLRRFDRPPPPPATNPRSIVFRPHI